MEICKTQTVDKLHFLQLDYQYRIQGHIVRSVTSHTINRNGYYNSVRWEQVALYSIVLTKYFLIVSVSKSEKKMHFLFECQCIKHGSTNRGRCILRLQLETVPPFYVVIRATQRSSLLQCKGSTFISRFF